MCAACNWGAVIRRMTRDRNVVNSSPGRSGGSLLRGQYSVMTLISVPPSPPSPPFPIPHVTAVAGKRSRPFWWRQVSYKHTRTLQMWLKLQCSDTQSSAWLYGEHRTCAETSLQWTYKNALCMAKVTHSESHNNYATRAQ